MKKIMLVCNAGMSTSLLVNKMIEAAKKRAEEIEIFASSEAESKKMLAQIDLVLLGPQVSYALADFEKSGKAYKIPVRVIDTLDYGRMDGEKVLDISMKVIDQHKGGMN